MRRTPILALVFACALLALLPVAASAQDLDAPGEIETCYYEGDQEICTPPAPAPTQEPPVEDCSLEGACVPDCGDEGLPECPPVPPEEECLPEDGCEPDNDPSECELDPAVCEDEDSGGGSDPADGSPAAGARLLAVGTRASVRVARHELVFSVRCTSADANTSATGEARCAARTLRLGGRGGRIALKAKVAELAAGRTVRVHVTLTARGLRAFRQGTTKVRVRGLSSPVTLNARR